MRLADLKAILIKRKEELLMKTIQSLLNRIELLQSRAGRENGRIIRKLERKVRNMLKVTE